MSESAAIRVLTLNAHQGFSGHRRRTALLRIREGLRAAGADLVFLQEVGFSQGLDQSTHQYEFLADGVWSQHAYGRNAVKTSGHHGNAILSKYPIVAWQNVDISVGSAEPRGLLHCVIDVQRPTPLHAVCLHLALLESHRRRQIGRLLDLVSSGIPADVPLVIAGDFNDWRVIAHRLLSQDGRLEEVHSSASGRPARTFPARFPMLRLDRIYVRQLRHRPWELPRHPWASLSDHAPLGGELWIR